MEGSLIEAIGQRQAHVIAQELLIRHGQSTPFVVGQVAMTCERIREQTKVEAERLGDIAERCGAELEPDQSGQLHVIKARLDSWESARTFIRELRGAGYVGWFDFDSGAEVALLRATSSTALVTLDDVPFAVNVMWPADLVAQLPGPFRPRAADVAVVSLPEKLWPLYCAIRPFRLAAERLGVREPRSRALGPILSTPRELISPLLEFAEVGPDDHLVDLGCGEGRIVIEAATTIGCRATGVELDARLVERGRDAISARGRAAASASLVAADATDYDLSDASVVFLFVPADAVGDLVKMFRVRGFAGRIISHEQEMPSGAYKPEISKIIATPTALTVAHRWG